jgi:translation initiation factor IF-2
MAKRLVKVAKELNVGTATIVDYLIDNGFEIENKPTAKITEAMENELLKEFQKSIAIKEKADQLVIGTRPSGKKESVVQEKEESVTTVLAPPVSTAKGSDADNTPAPPPTPEKEEKEEVKKEPEKIEAKEEKPVEKEKPRIKLNIKGKIDLDKGKKKAKKEEVKEEAPAAEVPAKEEPKEEVAPTPEPKEEVVEATPQAKEEPEVKEAPEPEPAKEEVAAATPKEEKPAKKAPAPKKKKEEPVAETPAKEKAPEETPAKEEAAGATDEEKAVEGAGKDKVIRAEAPELRGLKILGKIEIESKKKKKKKEPAKPANKADSKSDTKKGETSSGKDDGKQRRKRKRKKVTVSSSNAGRGGGGSRGGNRRGGPGSRRKDDEVKEVSKKEIEDKIKATMARMSGSGKKKRQRMRRDNRERLREKQEQREAAQQTDKLQLTEFISVQDLANLMDVSATEVITACMNLGVIVSINQRLDAEIIELVADEFNHEVEFITAEEQDEEEDLFADDPENLKPRAPIVTVMGHVDHGKTSLLDYIREAKVADDEAGGITQHIGAYEVRVGEENKKITFLDTPGHEAFTAMRARGAKVTDIAIIIIAADDSIMPQTREAISHAQAADVPIVFAINKIDKPGAQPDRIKQELASMNLLIEEWGGEYQSQDISAKTGDNIDQLLEKVLLVAELLELKGNPDRNAVGTVLEASLDKGRGYVSKMLVQTGTLEIGDAMVAGEHSGKVKAMFNERGKRMKKAGPSTPILVLGLSGAPQAGERFKIMDNEPDARQIAGKRAQIAREQANRAAKRISLDEIGRRLALGTFKELNLIVKGDVDGSVEALSDSLIKLSVETVQVNVIHKAVGQIIESDVLLASASDAIIIGFQVRPSLGARKLAEREGVQIKTYSIIYEAIDEVKKAIEGMLEPTKEEKIVCNVEVREVYKISKVGTVAGCIVQDGKINRNTHIRIIRNGIVIYPTKEGAIGELASLKRFKDDVKEVKSGMECGLTVKNFNDIKVGDVVEGYEIQEIKQTL